MLRNIFFVTFALLCLTFLTEAVQKSYIKCADSKSGSGNIQSLFITNCEVPPCILKKRSTVKIEQVFSVDRDIQKLTNKVQASVFGVSLSFIGVDNTEACGQIYNMDDTKAGCPLRAGNVYKYKNQFLINILYPSIPTTVSWKLTENGKVITCFDISARIK